MDASTVTATIALLALLVSVLIGVANFFQNRANHRQGSQIAINVDGNLSKALASDEAVRAELGALKVLVAALSAGRDGDPVSDTVKKAEDAAEAAAAATSAVRKPEGTA